MASMVHGCCTSMVPSSRYGAGGAILLGCRAAQVPPQAQFAGQEVLGTPNGVLHGV